MIHACRLGSLIVCIASCYVSIVFGQELLGAPADYQRCDIWNQPPPVAGTRLPLYSILLPGEPRAVFNLRGEYTDNKGTIFIGTFTTDEPTYVALWGSN